ncbi:MAG: PAS domain S-box protein [Proteobacteria bacterium]|nr:MAG: PAS domain S-box protein [Pseudomonadota bacterium]
MPTIRRYATALLFSVAALGLQKLFVIWSGVPSLGVFYPLIFILAYRSGLGPALLSIAITSVGSALYFYGPGPNFSVGSSADFVRHGIFTLTALASSIMLNQARKSRAELIAAKEATEVSQRRLNEFFAKAPLPIAILTGPELRFELVNDAHRKILAGSRSILGRPLGEVIPEMPKELGEALSRVYRTGQRFVGQQYPFELDWENNGRPYFRYLDFLYEPMHGPAGVEGVIAFAYDVTELVAARKALEESEQQIRAYAEAMPQMAFIADGQGSILYYNQRWYEYVGMAEGETEGWNWRDQPIHHPEDLDATVKLWQTSIATGAPYEVQYRLRRSDGSYRWHLGRAMPVRNREGEITRWFGTNTDIHEQKLVQEDLARAVKARDVFLSVAAHELRTPITALLLQSQLRGRLLNRQGAGYFGEDKLREMFAQDHRQADRLARLMDDILDVSHLSRERLALHRSDIDISTLVAELIGRVRPMFQVKDTVLSFDTPASLMAPLDGVRIERALSNLLLNALKYGEGSAVHVAVSVQGGQLLLQVIDGGPGIPLPEQERIFQRFERANASADITGLGLGLFISREIAEAHGGALRVESVPGKTMFELRLPHR